MFIEVRMKQKILKIQDMKEQKEAQLTVKGINTVSYLYQINLSIIIENIFQGLGRLISFQRTHGFSLFNQKSTPDINNSEKLKFSNNDVSSLMLCFLDQDRRICHLNFKSFSNI
jgi:hypothetical protein